MVLQKSALAAPRFERHSEVMINENSFAYPPDLAQVTWNAISARSSRGALPLPRLENLHTLLGTAFVASFERDELRRVRFRMAFAASARELEEDLIGSQSLPFADARPFSVEELRKLAPTVEFSTSALLVSELEDGELAVVGIIHTGSRWLRSVQGGRDDPESSTSAGFVIHVLGPGHLEVRLGADPVARLRRGQIVTQQLDVFRSSWLSARFAHVRAELLRMHEEKIHSDQLTSTMPVDPKLFGKLSQQMVKRSIAGIQRAEHGGLLLIVPQKKEAVFSAPNLDLSIRNRILDTPARHRHRALMLGAAELLAALAGNVETHLVGWEEYIRITDPRLDALDEALFQEAYSIAGLAAMDGAVVLNDRFEVLGFGAEIQCVDVHIPYIVRALNEEGTLVTRESLDGVGTRHRAAYRFVTKHPDTLAVVVSQDGGVRFVICVEGQLTCFEHDAGMVAELGR